MGKFISFQKVSKSFKKTKVLENLSFELPEGKFITLIGHNGAGKSTTLRIIAGTDEADSGEVQVLGSNPYSFSFRHRSDVFFIHEGIEFHSSMNLLEMMKIYRTVFPKWDNKYFNELMKERKISLKRCFMDLSSGQKMQFLLMVGLASHPRILLLDEITAVIDIEGQRFFLEKLKEFTSRGGTVVITTNILAELNDYTDHLLVIQDLKLEVDSSTSDLRKRFIVLKKTKEHEVFQHRKAAKIRKDSDGVDLYLIPREVVDEDTMVLQFGCDYVPNLEDILVLYFKLKSSDLDEELVA